MESLAGHTLLHVWESGHGQHSAVRALTVLSHAFPETAAETFLALSIGERDRRLLAVRMATFGTHASGQAECARCGERLELDVDLAGIVTPPAMDAAAPLHHVRAGGVDVRFRLPTTLDLQAITACRDVAEARWLLVRRCVVGATRDGAEMATDDLAESEVAALAAAMAERDPLAEVRLDLACPSCGERWLMPFDIEEFLWTEIDTRAKRLLRDVHMLAAVYHWREADILALSAARRQLYLEMVRDG